MKKFLALVSFVLLSVVVYGQRNPNIIRIGQNTYQASIKMDIFRFQKVTPQLRNRGDNDLSTYAACLQMILDYNGFNVTQEQIIATFPEVGGAGGAMLNMNSVRTSTWGRSTHIDCNMITINEDAIFDELSANRPIVVSRSIGEIEKATILTAMTYSIVFDANGNQLGITPLTVTLRNPDLNAQSTKIINWPDFSAGGNTLYTIKISEK